MRIVITGGYGFIGRLLAQELLRRGNFRDAPIETLTLVDLAAPADDGFTADQRGHTVTGDLTAALPELFAEPVDVVFHLASAVSAECERDLDLGLRVNLDATRALLEAARAQQQAGHAACTVVFSSSVAIYGADDALPLPEQIDESTLPLPQSSYGAQKFACEQLIADLTRRGVIDGRVVRLMTVAVRPGRPNAAASSFVSGIIREPLAGQPSVCPVRTDLELAIASPAATVAGLLRVAEAERGDGPGQLSGRLPVNLPALTVSVAEMLDGLREVAGQQALELVTLQPDPVIQGIVGSWPARFENSRAASLGLRPDPDIASVIEQYVATTRAGG